ncbi:MAG: hypothetical protein GY943_31290 [Chloroflexi bacterium]|nr:hypothetical protein [Chloroflexota bacterium]
MKTAEVANGSQVEASAAAPAHAKCPFCGCEVVLRHRRRMNSDRVTFFWRHQSNQKKACPARKRPMT